MASSKNSVVPLTGSKLAVCRDD